MLSAQACNIEDVWGLKIVSDIKTCILIDQDVSI